MDVTIRQADLTDVEAIMAIGAAVVPEHYTPILGQRAAQAQLAWWTSERMTRAVAAGRVHLAVVERDVVGVCETGEMDGEQVIWKVYLAPTYRGRPLGVELLRQAISSLPKDADHIAVEHRAGNARAARFYEREGFEVVGTDTAPSGEPHADAIVWRRPRLS